MTCAHQDHSDDSPPPRASEGPSLPERPSGSDVCFGHVFRAGVRPQPASRDKRWLQMWLQWPVVGKHRRLHAKLNGIASVAVIFPILCLHVDRGGGLSQTQDPVSRNTCRFMDHMSETLLGNSFCPNTPRRSVIVCLHSWRQLPSDSLLSPNG